MEQGLLLCFLEHTLGFSARLRPSRLRLIRNQRPASGQHSSQNESVPVATDLSWQHQKVPLAFTSHDSGDTRIVSLPRDRMSSFCIGLIWGGWGCSSFWKGLLENSFHLFTYWVTGKTLCSWCPAGIPDGVRMELIHLCCRTTVCSGLHVIYRGHRKIREVEFTPLLREEA